MPKKTNPYNLSDQQILFAKYYLEQGQNNAYKAALRAGYSKNYAKSRGHEVLETVGNYILDKTKSLNDKLGVSTEGQYHKLEEARLLAISKERPSDMVKAIEAQNKMLGLNAPDKVETTNEHKLMSISGVVYFSDEEE